MSRDFKTPRPQMHHAGIDMEDEGSTINVMKISSRVLDETGPSFLCFPYQGAGFWGSSVGRGSLGVGCDPTGTTIGA